MKNLKESQLAYILIAVYCIVLTAILFLTDGTGGDGDSTNHFLYAKYAFEHPENFFNHWAKPIYVWLFAPIAQLGFTAVQFFNVVLLAGSLIFTYKIGKNLNIQSALFPIIAIFATPMCIYWTLSGLTEPLFAFWLILGIYWIFEEKMILAIIWLSFLPFVRSEGLIIFCVLLLFLASKKRWKLIPLLSIGHMFFSILGYSVYGNFNWVFTKIPYNNLDSSQGYGIGTWDHYLVHFYEIAGPILSILIAIGLLIGLSRMIQMWRGRAFFTKNEIWLIYGIFVAFFIAHTLFWALGMFNSYGLLRVFLGIAPISALIGARAMEWLFLSWSSKLQSSFFWYLLLPLLLFNIFHKQSWHDLHLSNQQKAIKNFSEQNQALFQKENYTLYIDYPDGLFMLGLNPFDKAKHQTTTDFLKSKTVLENSWLIWDYRFSVIDHQNSLKKFIEHPDLQVVDTIGDKDQDIIFVVFKRKPLYIDKNESLFLNEDFEKSERKCVKTENQKHVLQLDSESCSFAPGLFIRTDDIISKPFIHYRFKAKKLSNDYILSYVTEYKDLKGNTLDWQAEEVWLSQENNWSSFEFRTILNHKEFPNSQLKIYLWLQKGSVLIDDIQIAH